MPSPDRYALLDDLARRVAEVAAEADRREARAVFAAPVTVAAVPDAVAAAARGLADLHAAADRLAAAAEAELARAEDALRQWLAAVARHERQLPPA
jgi:hypothetical protein